MCMVGTENVIVPLPIPSSLLTSLPPFLSPSIPSFSVWVWDRVLGEFEICCVWPELLSAGDWGSSVEEYPDGWPQSHARHLL